MKSSTRRNGFAIAVTSVAREAPTTAPMQAVKGSLILGMVLLLAPLGTVVASPSDPLEGDVQWVWQNPLPQGNTLQDVAFINASTGFAVGSRGTIIRTTDGGSSWDILESGTIHDLWGVSFVDASTGTVVGNFGVILRTTDGGDSWTVQREEPSGVLFSVSFTDADTGSAVGADGLIVRTTDGGVNWVEQTSGTTHWLHDVFFTDTDNGTAVGEGGTILRTTDGGDRKSVV